METLKKFKKFLATECYDEKEYGDGKYDKKIYDWFVSQIEPAKEAKE